MVTLKPSALRLSAGDLLPIGSSTLRASSLLRASPLRGPRWTGRSGWKLSAAGCAPKILEQTIRQSADFRRRRTIWRGPRTAARQLIDAIDATTIIGLRDRALIGLMVYSFARIGAAIGMRVEDVYTQNRRLWVRLRGRIGRGMSWPIRKAARRSFAVGADRARLNCSM